MPGPLAGLRIVEMVGLGPAPFAAMMLADAGADVIRVHQKGQKPEIPLMNTRFDVLARGRRSIALDLKDAAERAVMLDLVARADALLEGFRPGVTRRLGVDYDTISKINPKIIYCSISGYGQTGPCRDTAGHDVNYLSVAGVLDLIGPKDGPPCIPGIQIADMAGGGLYAVIGILAALHARTTTGCGQYIDISMTDGSMTLLSLVLSLGRLTGKPVKRSDSFLSHRYACYHVYETADHRYLSIGAVENRFWKNLCDYFGVPEYAPLQYDDSRREELLSFVEQRIRQKTLIEWEKELAGLDICWGPVRTAEEALASPLFADREMVVEIPEKNGGSTTGIGIPVKLSKTPGTLRTPAPAFGENTLSILRSMGYSEEKIIQFQESGIV